MKAFLHKFVASTLILIILTTLPQFLLAQNRFAGELVIIKNSSEGFVSINGEHAVSGRSVTSTSEIITSPQTSAKISVPQTGNILLSPNTKLLLSFANSSISGDLSSGEITIETVANTSINLLTSDGSITLPTPTQANIFKVVVENKKTRIQTLTGSVNYNNVVISAGEFYPLAANTDIDSSKSVAADSSNSNGFNPLLIVGVLGAVAIAVVVALSSSANKNNTSTVSPTR